MTQQALTWLVLYASLAMLDAATPEVLALLQQRAGEQPQPPQP